MGCLIAMSGHVLFQKGIIVENNPRV